MLRDTGDRELRKIGKQLRRQSNLKSFLLAPLALFALVLAGFIPLTTMSAAATTTGTLTIVTTGGSEKDTTWSVTAGLLELTASTSVNAAAIESELASGSLILFADEIQVNSSLSFGANSLTFRSNGSVRIPGGVTVTSTGGNIMLQADSNNSGVGEIKLGTLATNGGSISSGGGKISLVGGSSATGFAMATRTFETGKPAAGVAFYGFDLNAGGGDILIQGSSGANTGQSTRGITFETTDSLRGSKTSSIETSGSGSVNIIGDGSSIADSNKWGINIGSLDVDTGSGNVSIKGKGNTSVSGNVRGIAISTLTIQSVSGNLLIHDDTVGTSGTYTGFYIGGSVTMTSGGTAEIKADKYTNDGSVIVAASSFNIFSSTGNSFLATTSFGTLALTGTPVSRLGTASNVADLIISGTIVSDGDVVMNSSGAITQTNKIETSGLRFGGTGSAMLTNTSNDANVISGGTSGSPASAITFVDKDDLEIGTVESQAGIYSSGVVDIATLAGDLNVTQVVSSTATSTDSIMLYADKNEAAGSAGEGDIKISGSGSLALDSTARALLYSGSDVTSTSLTTTVGGALNSRGGIAASTSLGSISPSLAAAGRFALYRVETTILDVSTPSIPQPISQPYSGPIPISLNPSLICSQGVNQVVLTGRRLAEITSATVDGKPAVISGVSYGSITLTLPPLSPGTYSVIYSASYGPVTYKNSLVVGESACGSKVSPESESESESDETPAVNNFYAAKRFANYLGDRPGVVNKDELAITSFLSEYQGITKITCLGSTSGVPAVATDLALATIRANNACDIARKLYPDAEFSIRTSTGKGIGQFYRSVSVFVAGTNPSS